MIIKTVDISSAEYLSLAARNGTVFNQTEWLKLYGNNIHVKGIYNLNNELIGAFNVFKAEKLGFSYWIVPPYSPSNALFFLNPAENNSNKITFEKEVHLTISNYFSSLGGFLKTMAFPTWVTDTQVYFWQKFKVIPNYTYQLNLSKSPDELFENLTTEKRKSIRRAEKDELEIRKCEDYAIARDLILKTFDRKNKRLNTKFLDGILYEFANSENSFVFVAYYKNQPSACTFCIHYNKVSYYLFGGYDNSNKHHGAGVSCMWHSILHARNLGITIFDFEGSMLPEVERYFREFGGDLVPYYTIHKAWLPLELLLKFKMRNRF